MTQEGHLPPPPVTWAQRRDVVYITICLEDCKDVELEIQPEIVYFKAIGGTEQKLHEVQINLYKEIDSRKAIKNLSGRTIELTLPKKKEGPYWPRLIKEKTKAHWLKIDFNKWKDEDDSDDQLELTDGNDLEEMMRQMGGLRGSGDSKPMFDDLEDEIGEGGEELDSDDEDIPELLD